MKGITKAQVKKDLDIIEEMSRRYVNGIYGETNFKPSDWEQQFKQVMIATAIISEYLLSLKMHLLRLAEDCMPIVEDEE